jgi:phosphoenolpyruvate-protein kinase (PTS system EI component)
MKQIKRFNQFNESVLGTMLIVSVAGVALRWWLNSLSHDNIITKYLHKVKDVLGMKRTIDISESNDLFLINVGDGVLIIDKNERTLSYTNKQDSRKKIKLSKEEYNKFLNIIKNETP